MASKVDKGKGVAFAKRAKISKAQQSMLIAIGLASVVLGVTLVGVIYLVKVIRFNMDIISEKDESIKGFSRVQTNLKTIASKVGDLAVSVRPGLVISMRLWGAISARLQHHTV